MLRSDTGHDIGYLLGQPLAAGTRAFRRYGEIVFQGFARRAASCRIRVKAIDFDQYRF